MNELTSERVLAALRQVRHPHRGRRRGQPRHDLRRRDQKRQCRLRHRGPSGGGAGAGAAAQGVRAGGPGMPGVLSCTAVLTAERAPGGRARRGTAAHPGRRAAAGSSRPLVPGVKSIIAVASGKGGVGKSTTAVNLAMGLAAIGQRVGLLDADIYGPSHAAHGRHRRPAQTADGKKLRPMESYGVKVMSMGFLVDEDAPMIWRGPMVQSALAADAGRRALGRARRPGRRHAARAPATPSSPWRRRCRWPVP